jgi:hypothetical protein
LHLAKVGNGKAVVGSERQCFAKLLAGRGERRRLAIDAKVGPRELLDEDAIRVFLDRARQAGLVADVAHMAFVGGLHFISNRFTILIARFQRQGQPLGFGLQRDTSRKK